jgi:hypothetical protein
MLAVVSLATDEVVTVKVVAVEPAATVALAGASATDVLLLVSATIAPVAAAGPFRVMVAVDELPPVTEGGLKLMELRTGAVTVRAAVWVAPRVPERVSAVSDETGVVLTVKGAVVCPALTVTVAGGCAADGLLLDRVTTAPLVGAGAVRVTVPVAEVPPRTDVGPTLTELRDVTGTVTVKLATDVVP